MAETRGVFDSLLKDISGLQKEINSFKESHDLDQLENHLSERIATLFENAMETSAVQGESLKSLDERVRNLTTVVTRNSEQSKHEIISQGEEL